MTFTGLSNPPTSVNDSVNDRIKELSNIPGAKTALSVSVIGSVISPTAVKTTPSASEKAMENVNDSSYVFPEISPTSVCESVIGKARLSENRNAPVYESAKTSDKVINP